MSRVHCVLNNIVTVLVIYARILFKIHERSTQIMMAPETVVTTDHNKPTAPSSQQQGGTLDWIKIDIDYFKTTPGLLKVVQLVSSIVIRNNFLTSYNFFAILTRYITLH